jgi:arsenate reductase
MTLILYHNPRCSKSREALRLLEEKGLHPKIVKYLETPPTASEIAVLLKKLRIPARDLMRTSEQVFKSLGLDDPNISDKALIAAMADNPVLIERPILISGRRAVIGRPPERVLDII